MKRLLVVNMLYSFIAAAMAVIVPLYLIEKNVDIALIGIILSIGPLSFMLIRTFLASIADEIGTRMVDVVYSIASILAVALYTFVISPLGFAAATLAEGVRASGFWAVVRTETISESSSRHPGAMMAYFSSMRQIADGAGRLAAGLLLAWLAFQGSFALMFALSLALLAGVIIVNNNHSNVSRHGRSVAERIFKPRPRTFWHASMVQVFAWLPYNALIGFVIPVYLASNLGMGYEQTGSLVALLALGIGAFALLSVKTNFRKRTLVLLSLPVVPALLLFPFAGTNVLPLLLVIAIGTGCMSIVAEYMLVDQIYRSRDISTDIGVFFSPLKVAEFLFLSSGGLVIARFGYAPLFIILALCMAIFVLMALKLLDERH